MYMSKSLSAHYLDMSTTRQDETRISHPCHRHPVEKLGTHITLLKYCNDLVLSKCVEKYI